MTKKKSKMSRIEKIKKLCNPKLSWGFKRLGLSVQYTSFGHVYITELQEADHCSPEEAIKALEDLAAMIKKHSNCE